MKIFIKRKKPFSLIAKGLEISWLPGRLSENVLLWDKVRLEIKRGKIGHKMISLMQ